MPPACLLGAVVYGVCAFLISAAPSFLGGYLSVVGEWAVGNDGVGGKLHQPRMPAVHAADKNGWGSRFHCSFIV